MPSQTSLAFIFGGWSLTDQHPAPDAENPRTAQEASVPPDAVPAPRPTAQSALTLSPGAAALVKRAFADIDGRAVIDSHVHIIGLGTGESGAYANPKLLTWKHPASHVKASIILKSTGVTGLAQADEQYVQQLLAWAGEFPAPLVLAALAFDYHYTKDGAVDLGKTEFYVPDEYILRLARRYPGRLIPVVSIHPYAPNALKRLEQCAQAGARLVKWLPNAQGMDPADPAIDPFYQAMERHHMALLCHTGWEMSVNSDGQRLGNPLRLRRPLDLGVAVIMAHVGNTGANDDLDNPGKRVSNFALALRMLDDPKYRDRLYSDIAMIVGTTRNTHDIKVLLERTDLHPRLINGSDYPLPAVDVAVSPILLQLAGLITNEERRHLAEIRRQNPLLFDFVLKRALKDPKTGVRFPASMFTLP